MKNLYHNIKHERKLTQCGLTVFTHISRGTFFLHDVEIHLNGAFLPVTSAVKNDISRDRDVLNRLAFFGIP